MEPVTVFIFTGLLCFYRAVENNFKREGESRTQVAILLLLFLLLYSFCLLQKMGPLKSGKAEAVGTDFILPPPGVAFHSEISINIQIHNCACGEKNCSKAIKNKQTRQEVKNIYISTKPL